MNSKLPKKVSGRSIVFGILIGPIQLFTWQGMLDDIFGIPGVSLTIGVIASNGILRSAAVS
jgi:hypothetical protein